MQAILLCLKPKQNQINKALKFGLFCSYFPVLSFLHVILINSTIYFRGIARVFDFPISGGYDVG